MVSSSIINIFAGTGPNSNPIAAPSTSAVFFVINFNLLSCEFDNFTFTLLYWVVFANAMLNQN